MKRLSSCTRSGSNSPRELTLENSLSLSSATPSKQSKLEEPEPDIEVIYSEITVVHDTIMIIGPQLPFPRTTTHSQPDSSEFDQTTPSFRRNHSADDVATPEKAYCEPFGPRAASTDGKRKKQRTTGEVLDWKNFNGPKKETTKAGIHHRRFHTGGQVTGQNVKAIGQSVNVEGGVPTIPFIPDAPGRPRKQRSNGSTSSANNQTTTTPQSAGEISGRKEKKSSDEYGRPPEPQELKADMELIVNFGTKNNPVGAGVNLNLDGNTSKSPKGKKVPHRQRRSQSCSSERGALGLRIAIVPMTIPRPVAWGTMTSQGNDEGGETPVSNNEKGGDGGCCEEEWKDTRMERKADKEVPEHKEEYIDSHCHLDFIYERHYFEDMDSLRENFKESFLPTFKGCIANFIKPSTFQYKDWIGKVVQDKQVLGTSWGIHPHHSGTCTEQNLDDLKDYIIKNREELKIVAIGECGIDLSGKNDIPLEKQLKVFKFQVQMAYELDLPIIIHCREGRRLKDDPEDEVLNVLKERPNHPIHRHCFTRDAMVAKKWMNTLHDCSFGFTPKVIYSSSFEKLLEKIIPIDRIHLETDAPYFKPMEYKCFSGLPNNCSVPSAAISVAIRISELTGYSLDEVIRRTRGCTDRIYRLHRSS